MSFSFRSWSLRAGVLAAAAGIAAGTASAGNITYSFNANPGTGWSVSDALGISGTAPSAWEWTAGASVDEGGWHSRYGAEAAGTATVLESPYFQVDTVGQHYVRMEILDRYNFPTSGTSPVTADQALGQIQFSINNGPWLGIRTADFNSDANHHYPTFANPPAPLLSSTPEPTGGPWPVEAFAGTTPLFADGKHHDATFTLSFPPDGTYSFGPGDWLRFRFVMAIDVPGSPTAAPINWEINKLQIDGISAVVVPEPGAVTLAGLGIAVGGVACVRRRRRVARATA